MYSLLLFSIYFFFFFFDDTSTSEIYTLSLHDALPILAILAALTTLGIFVAVRHLPTPGDISQVLGHHPGAYTLSLGHMLDLTFASFAYLRLPLLVASLAFLAGAIGTFRWRGERSFLAAAVRSEERRVGKSVGPRRP